MSYRSCSGIRGTVLHLVELFFTWHAPLCMFMWKGGNGVRIEAMSAWMASG